MAIKDFLAETKVKYFIGGIVAGYVIKKVAETDCAHKLAVNLTAGALNLKDTIESEIETIKEDAEDIHAEAKEKRQIEIFDSEEIDEEIEEENEE